MSQPSFPAMHEVMKHHPLKLSPKMHMVKAEHLLAKKKYSAAPVVDDDGQLVGLLTELMCLEAMASAVFYDEPVGIVANHMTTQVRTVTPEDTAENVTDIFRQTGYRQLPVLEDGRLVGVVSRNDLMEAMRRFWKHQAPSSLDAIAQEEHIHNPFHR